MIVVKVRQRGDLERLGIIKAIGAERIFESRALGKPASAAS